MAERIKWKIDNFTFLDDWSKTAISDLKYEEYSAWFIDNTGSAYQRKDSKKD